MNSKPHDLFVWLGPAIGPKNFEVGHEVYEQFTEHNSQAKSAFKPTENGKHLMNIYLIATQQLNQFGVTAVYSEDFCTYSDKENFYSYRRNNQTGRMASLIWFI